MHMLPSFLHVRVVSMLVLMPRRRPFSATRGRPWGWARGEAASRRRSSSSSPSRSSSSSSCPPSSMLGLLPVCLPPRPLPLRALAAIPSAPRHLTRSKGFGVAGLAALARACSGELGGEERTGRGEADGGTRSRWREQAWRREVARRREQARRKEEARRREARQRETRRREGEGASGGRVEMLFGTNEIKLQSLSGLLGSARPSSQTNKRFRTGQNFPLLDSVSSFSFRFFASADKQRT